MRIGIEAQRIFRNKKHGMDIYALQLIKELQKIDKKNNYVIFVKKGPDVCLEETDNFKIVYVPGISYIDWEQFCLPYYLRKHKVDLLHCTSNTAPLVTGIRKLVTVHDIIYLQNAFAGGSTYQAMGHYYRKYVVPSAMKKAEKVFTVSKHERQEIMTKTGLENEKVEVIYNGVSDNFKPLKSTRLRSLWRKKLNLPSNYIFYHGNLVPKKNLERVIKAYEIYHDRSKDPLPLIITEIDKSIIDRLEVNSKAKDNILTVGYVKHQMLSKYYALADLFLYPSLIESFGIPIIEAMACGTRVITSNTSSMPEVAGNLGYLVDPYNENQIAQAINYVIKEEVEKESLIEHSQNFTWRKTALQTLRHYDLVEKELYKKEYV